MTISVVQTATFNAASSGSFGSNVGAGNTVFLIQYAYSVAGASISTSNPLFGGASVTGASQLLAAQSAGSNAVYGAIWMLPNLAGGAASVALTVTNGTVDSNVGLVAIEVSGLGSSPAIDSGAAPNPKTATGQSTNPASGSTGNLAQAPEFVTAMAVEFGVSLTPPGTGGWTNLSPGAADCQAGYQVVTSAGSSFAYNTTSGSVNNWAAGVVAVYAAAGAPSGTVQPRATVPVPRRRPARGQWGGVQGQAFVKVPAPVQQFRTAPRRVLARAVWRGIAGQAFVAVPAPRQLPQTAPRRKPARAVVQFRPVATTNAAAVTPPSGTVQPRATVPVPRRAPARGQWRGISGQAFVFVPAPRQQPRPAPRRVPARAYVRFVPVTTVNAPPVAGGAGGPRPGDSAESRLIRRYRHMQRRHGLDGDPPEVSMLAAPVAVDVPPGWPGTWPAQLTEPEPEPAAAEHAEPPPAPLVPSLPPALAGLGRFGWPGVWPDPLPEPELAAPPPPKWRPVYVKPPKIVRARRAPRDAMMPVWRKDGSRGGR